VQVWAPAPGGGGGGTMFVIFKKLKKFWGALVSHRGRGGPGAGGGGGGEPMFKCFFYLD